ncbi:RNA-dependent RNA polymerase-associated nucleotidyltransferase (macronuclear) [Tetrahymena thermophila SB210]|uniref:RNA-dependent RNA polymerase-associated nucleotidyltransferase n=2 Tax=Tetrahymena thermophila TaxID=5911 RepID=Q235Y7_TETTS|nr:RNA-dependent RNA polymerase-associated nucleotidyltransferase [Tetrahymena thermophila SB210]ABS32300.1 RNA-dependent RNA polymerase-associated nucleotidyltransferase 1 [Tetrahymena thermophila]EAR92613.2 RNA-dependent RNA polymerase-associated nucleotidyltransferase [Tetrahymena thermophila SB210]|eukprot:XP_001012858.2 RNA-dependent RNA polymerase-associated nucleotidyltransferase [Tetrahymena thermophila SB210]
MNINLTDKQKIYSNVIKNALEKIYKNDKVDILNLINTSLGCQTIEIKYDVEFHQLLAQYFQNMRYQDTKDKEDVLQKLLEQCLSQNLILNTQKSKLSKQIIILKRLRRIQQKLKDDPKNALDHLIEEYDQEEENCDEEVLLQRFEQDKTDLRMQIEDNVKDLKKENIKYLLLKKQNNQEKNIQNEQNLEQILLDVYNQQKIEESFSKRLLQEVNFIRKIISMMRLKELFGLEYVTVQPYGSIVSGFAQKSSDVDISINTNCYIDESSFIQLLHNFIKQYCSNKSIKNVETEPVLQAQTPLLKYTRKDTVDQQQIKIDIDICVNNILGCTNSLMLYTLSQLHPKIQQLGIIIKHWAKQRGVSSKSHLSSYSFILMMFSFLFREKILNSEFVKKSKSKENQCQVKIKRKKKDGEQIFQTNLYFYSNVEDLKMKLAIWRKEKNLPSLDDVSLSQLFIDFIKFYQSSFNFKDKRFISIFNFDVNYSNNNFKYELYDENYYFNIEDPFDTKHNPGQKTQNKQEQYKQAFDDALNQIESKQYNLLFSSK